MNVFHAFCRFAWQTRSVEVSRATATVLATFAIAIGAARLQASDHIDWPTIAQDRGSDIADIYAFLDPNDNSQSS